TTLFANPDLINVGTLLLIDKFGEIIYSTDEFLFDGNTKRYISSSDVLNQFNEKYHHIYDINFFSGWKVTALIPESQINQGFESIKRIVIILLGVFFFISILLAWFLSKRFIFPLRRLQRDIREVEKGDFQIRAEIDSIDE